MCGSSSALLQTKTQPATVHVNRADLSMGTPAEILQRRKERFSKKNTIDDYGLLSRGEDFRLQEDAKAREEFFGRIKTRHAKEGSSDWVLMSLRKLREALIKFPSSSFAKNVFLFSVRCSVDVQHHQSYVPAIARLLQVYISDLDGKEEHEILLYLILHKMHFNESYNEALSLFQGLSDQKIRSVLVAFATDDWYTWLRLLKEMGQSDSTEVKRFSRVMELGRSRMVSVALKSIGASYFVMKQRDVESFTAQTWAELQDPLAKNGFAWKLSGETVTIRERRK